MRALLNLLPLLFFGTAAAAAAAAATAPVLVVDLLSSPPPPQTVIAVQACAGLLNRNATSSTQNPLAYVLLHPEDAPWLATLVPALPNPAPLTPVDTFLAACLAPGGPAAGRIRYAYAGQQVLVPLLLTAAGALGGVPLEDGAPWGAGAPLLLDALARWGQPNASAAGAALNATADAFSLFGDRTTGLAKMNPGFDWAARADPLDPAPPPLTAGPDLSLADHIVAARLFNFYLPNGCVPGTDENALLIDMVSGAPAPWGAPPYAVLGYDDTWPLAGGDIFEAETTCDLASPSLGQVATSGVSNLAFFAHSAAPVTAPLTQAPLPAVAYNASRTYVSFVVGDGDNIAYVKSTRWEWFQARAQACAAAAAAAAESPLCSFPLGWSLSPHLTTLAPGILRWYYETANLTGRDYFVLPPSGHLYAYPALMPADVQASFVAATEEDARLLNTSTTVEWEVMGTWAEALAAYAPRYGLKGQVRSLVAVNVPYLVPVLEFADGETVKVVGGANGSSPVAVFAPFEWRGTTGGGLPPFMQNATQWATQLIALPPGSLVSIYLTSDGGAVWQDFADLAAELAAAPGGAHVEVVPPDTLGLLAAEAGRAGGARGKE